MEKKVFLVYKVSRTTGNCFYRGFRAGSWVRDCSCACRFTERGAERVVRALTRGDICGFFDYAFVPDSAF